jgi:hypothetical protein
MAYAVIHFKVTHKDAEKLQPLFESIFGPKTDLLEEETTG